MKILKKDTPPEMTEHVCTNCEYKYVGNFCPKCGQEASVGLVNWKTVVEEGKTLLGLNTQSPLSTVARLLWRPGKLISDYNSGQRLISDKPTTVLWVVVATVSFIMKMTGVQIGIDTVPEAKGFMMLEKVVVWLMNNLGWAVMLMTLFYIFPTWFLFRFSPRHTAHTWPEGIFIQLFMCSLVLIFMALGQGVSIWLYLLIPVYYIIAYYQLFGYGIWGTTWRVLLVFIVSAIAVLLLVWTFLSIVNGEQYVPSKYPAWMTMVTVGIALVFIPGSLWIGYLISKRTARSRQATSDHLEG